MPWVFAAADGVALCTAEGLGFLKTNMMMVEMMTMMLVMMMLVLMMMTVKRICFENTNRSLPILNGLRLCLENLLPSQLQQKISKLNC